MDTFRFDSVAISADPVTVQPPHFPQVRGPAADTVAAWAKRVVERIRSESVSGKLRIPRYVDLTKDDATARTAYDEMLAEPMVMAPLRVLVDSVASLDLQVIPDDPDNEREQEEAEFVRWAFKRVEGGRLALIRAIAFNGLRRGWSVTEPVWSDPQPLGSKYALRRTWKQWKDKDTAEVEPITDDFRNLVGIREKKTGTVFSPADFIVYSHLRLFMSPQGLSALRTAYDDWIAKKTAVQLWGLNLEKWGSPFLLGTYTDEASQRAALELALTNAEANTWCTAPVGTLITAITASSGSPANFQAFIERCDKAIAISIMASHLPIMEGSNQTVAGSTKEQRNTTELYQWALAEEMSHLLTAAAAVLVGINASGVTPPQVVLGAVSETEIASMLGNDAILHGMGFPLSMASLASRTGREMARDDSDKLPTSQAPPSPFGFAEGDDPPPGPAPPAKQVAPSGADGKRAAELLQRAQQEGATRLGKACRSAVERLLNMGADTALRVTQLFDPSETGDVADVLAATVATADLLGRSRIRLRYEKAIAGGKTFSEQPTDFSRFDEQSPPPLMRPERALDYFRRLVPTIGVDPLRWGEQMQRTAFTLAVNTDAVVLEKVQSIIRQRLETGIGIGTAPAELEDVLTQAGVSSRNPQYSEMVFRTNAIDSLNTGADEEMKDPDVADYFVAWKYASVADSRSRPEHAARNGNYYPNEANFVDVRGRDIEDAANCRCTFIPVSRPEWEKLQANGVTFAS